MLPEVVIKVRKECDGQKEKKGERVKLCKILLARPVDHAALGPRIDTADPDGSQVDPSGK